MSWGAIFRAVWTKGWPFFAVCLAFAVFGLGSWAVSILFGFTLGLGSVTIAAVVAAVLLVLAGAALAEWKAPAPPDTTEFDDVFSVTVGTPTIELVGGPFDGQRIAQLEAGRDLWVAVSPEGTQEHCTAIGRPTLRDGVRVLGGYYRDEHDTMTWTAGSAFTAGGFSGNQQISGNPKPITQRGHTAP